MTFLEQQKTFELPLNTLYNENGCFRWTGPFIETIEFLATVIYHPNANIYFQHYQLNYEFMEICQGWDLETLTKSALFLQLEEKINLNKRLEQPLINSSDWELFFRLLLNPTLSISIIDFIEQLDLKKISSNKMIFSGFSSLMLDVISFDQHIYSKKGLRNILLFLEIDSVSYEQLVNKAFKEKSVKPILDFLAIIEAGLYKRCVLTESLQLYKGTTPIPNQTEIKELKKTLNFYINAVLEVEFDDLESFTIFDMFESAEISKSKSSEILFYTFYQTLIENIISKCENPDFEIFQLFEESLIIAKNTSFILEATSLSGFHNLVNTFLLANEKTVDFWLEKNKNFFQPFLKVFKKDNVIVLYFLSCFFIVTAINHSQKLDLKREKILPPFGMLSSAALRHQIENHFATQTTIRPNPPPGRVNRFGSLNQLKFHRHQQTTRNFIFVTTASSSPGRIHQVNESRARFNAKYPKTTTLFNIEPGSANGSPLLINILNRRAPYKDGKNMKKALGRFLKQESVLFDTQNTPADFEDALISPLHTGLQVRRENGRTFYLLRALHKKHTTLMKFPWTPEFGYGQQRNTALEWVDYLSGIYTSVFENMFSDTPPKNALLSTNLVATGRAKDFIIKYGIEFSDIIKASTLTFSDVINDLDKMNIPNKLLLPYIHSNMINDQAYRSFDLALGVLDPVQYDLNKSQVAKMVNAGLYQSRNVVIHYQSVLPLMIEGTGEGLVIRKNFARAQRAAHTLIDHAVNDLGCRLEPEYVKLWDLKVSNRLDLDEIDCLARTKMNLYQVKHGLPSFIAPGSLPCLLE